MISFVTLAALITSIALLIISIFLRVRYDSSTMDNDFELLEEIQALEDSVDKHVNEIEELSKRIALLATEIRAIGSSVDNVIEFSDISRNITNGNQKAIQDIINKINEDKV
tara:strand:+ start:44 stop:376 length:333 start_codon:yes stop_codon:yes gene_type:complete